jgi:RNA polymerase sigma-70 factor (ECF subfamily)
MAPEFLPPGPGGPAPRRFLTTRWSLVLAAGQKDPRDAREALAELCQTYWYPLYAYLRRWGNGHEAAEDLVQGFFVHLLEKDVVARANQERGRFRSFLLASLKHYAANEHARATTRKRGGDHVVLDLDDQDARARYALEPKDVTDPERLFERRWALTLVERARAHLRQDFVKAGRLDVFETLQGVLTDEGTDLPYRDLAAALGTSEGAARVTVHRLRKRFRQRLEREIADTVADDSQVPAELHFLQATLGAGHRGP